MSDGEIYRRNLQALRSPHGRRSTAAANEFTRRISEFFTRISDRYKNWKLGRKEADLHKSEDKALKEILAGLSDAAGSSRKIHQGLKRLLNAERKLHDSDVSYGKNFDVLTTLEAAAYTLAVTFRKKATKHLRKLSEDRSTIMGQYSDLNKPFHRMLVRLDKFGLLPSGYVASRTERITDLDKKIEFFWKGLKIYACTGKRKLKK